MESVTVKVGQVWKTKDKRRDTTIEITEVFPGNETAHTKDRSYTFDQLGKRWELVKDVSVSTEKITRELWLEKATDVLRTDLFAPLDFDVPTVRVSVGWAGGRGPKGNVIGQCWAPEHSTDKVGQIFISPALGTPDAVLETLVHELIHAINHVAGDGGHKTAFKKISDAVGLEGKLTSTHAGDILKEKLVKVAEGLGEYPHSPINIEHKPVVQKTYQLKVVCVYDPGYKVRMTQKMADDWGMPICPCHEEPMTFE